MQRFRDGEFWIFGFSLLISYSTLSSVTGTQISTDHALSAESWMLGRFLQIAVYLATALLCVRGVFPTQSRAARLLATGICSASLPLQLLCRMFLPEIDVMAHTALTSLGQAGYALLWMSWIELFTRLNLRHLLIDYLLVHVLSAVLSFSLSWLSPTFLIPCIACMPWAATFMQSKAGRVLDGASYACGERSPHPWTFPVAPVALMVIFSTVNVFVRGMLPDESAVYATAGVAISCLVFVAVVLLRGVGSFDIWQLGSGAFVFSLAGLLGAHMSSALGTMAAALCTNAGFALFNVLLVVALGNVSYRYGVKSVLLFGFSKAAEGLAYPLGKLLVSNAERADGDGFALLVIVLAMLLSLGFIALMRGREESPSWGVGFDISNPRRYGQQPTLEQHCAAVSREAGLTRREEEVLLLLALDRSASQIEQALCITNATVKTHTQSVYRKLNVHSRKEIVHLLSHPAGTFSATLPQSLPVQGPSHPPYRHKA